MSTWRPCASAASDITLWSDNGLREWLDSCAVIVDALLGTGTARPIEGDLAQLLITVKQAVVGPPIGRA